MSKAVYLASKWKDSLVRWLLIVKDSLFGLVTKHPLVNFRTSSVVSISELLVINSCRVQFKNRSGSA